MVILFFRLNLSICQIIIKFSLIISTLKLIYLFFKYISIIEEYQNNYLRLYINFFAYTLFVEFPNK